MKKTRPNPLIILMALRFRAERDGTAPGHALADLRQRILASTQAGAVEEDDVARAEQEYDRIVMIGVADMPPETDDIALLLDALCFRHGYSNRADAWRHIGINPNRGREFLARNAKSVDWPIWFTLTHAALGI